MKSINLKKVFEKDLDQWAADILSHAVRQGIKNGTDNTN